jgi:hypothetical protein
VFDSGGNGLSSTLTAELWSRNENGTPGNFTDDTAGTRLAQLTFTAADPGTLVGGSRFKRLATALTLAPGAYTMSAYGYSTTEPNGKRRGGTEHGGRQPRVVRRERAVRPVRARIHPRRTAARRTSTPRAPLSSSPSPNAVISQVFTGW